MVSLGEYSLYLTVPFALFSIAAAAYGSLRERPEWVRSAERGVLATFVLLCLAMIGLEAALVGDRFDLAFVYSISSREQPLIFKLALWGGHDGSLLLWGWMLGGMSALVVLQNRQRNRRLMPWVVVSQMANVLFFVSLMSFSKNPFAAAEVALSNGAGMNPILQHPVMLIHPPILYVGFVGFSVPFSFALAALISGELGTSWFRTTRRWTLVAWFFSGTWALMLGGRWAYEVLGWGGYWAWDPVENSSLMPWLAGDRVRALGDDPGEARTC